MGDNETRTKIIKAAEELFKQKDYEDISIREICQLAGISIGAFYRHIGSKEQLFKIFHIQLGTEALKILFEKIDNKTPMEKISVVIDIYLDLITYFGYKFVKYFLTLSLNNEIFANPPGALHTFLKEYITEASNNGEFKPEYTIDYIFRALFSSLRGAAFDWSINAGKSDIKADYSITLNILLNEFKKK